MDDRVNASQSFQACRTTQPNPLSHRLHFRHLVSHHCIFCLLAHLFPSINYPCPQRYFRTLLSLPVGIHPQSSSSPSPSHHLKNLTEKLTKGLFRAQSVFHWPPHQAHSHSSKHTESHRPPPNMRASTILSILPLALLTHAQVASIDGPIIPGTTGKLGDAAITRNNPAGVTYTAVLPNSNTTGIRGFVSGTSNANGTGVVFTMNLSGFPSAALGPFRKSISPPHSHT